MLKNLVKLFKSYKHEFVAGVFGAAFFCIFWGEIVNPAYIDWMVRDGWDTFQHYLGWAFYRDSSWYFPIGIAQNLGHPIGIPISYMDSIPLVAILLKPFLGILPESFQYFGLWLLFSFFLQGIFGYKLSYFVLKNKKLSLLASLFFIASPIAIYRIAGHASLASHWLILWSLYLVVKYNYKFPVKNWVPVLVISLLVHPYFVFINGPIMVAHLIFSLYKKNITAVRAGFYLIVQSSAVLILGWSVGLFYIGDSSSSGIGQYSMNLNSLVNPFWGDWSVILPNLATGPYQYEGFSYLGIGILLLIALAIFAVYNNFSKKQTLANIKNYWIYYLLGLSFVILAVGPSVVLGDKVLLDININYEPLKKVLNTVRSSGRFIWPVYYVLFLFALFGVKYKKKKMAAIMLVVAFCLQIYDFSYHLWGYQDPRFENQSWEITLPQYWENLPEKYDHIHFIPSYPQDKNMVKSSYPDIAMFAAKNNMTLNKGYFARMLKGNYMHIVREEDKLERGEHSSSSVYILLPEKSEIVDKYAGNSDLVKQEKDYILYAPGFYK